MTGRVENGILTNDSSGLTQIKSNVNRIRQNYTYPAWFANTLSFAENGRISERELYLAFDNLSNQGLVKLKVKPTQSISVSKTPTQLYARDSFEKLYPEQTQQLIKMGKDTTDKSIYNHTSPDRKHRRF